MTYHLKNITAKYAHEKRVIVKNIINTPGDIIPDHENQTLTISLYSLATPKLNEYAKHLCAIINESKTKYPGTNLTLIYEMAT